MRYKALRTDTFREIKRTLSRFFSILIIVGLGVGFFVGVKATAPSMMQTTETYLANQNLMDIKILSTFGFNNKDVKKIEKIKGVEAVVPSYSADLILESSENKPVIKVMALYDKGSPHADMNKPVLIDGRLPEKENECVIEDIEFIETGYEIGDTVTFAKVSGDTETKDIMKNRKFVIVGTVKSPMYLTFDHGTTYVGKGVIDFFVMIPESNFLYPRYTEVYVTCDTGKGSIFGKGYEDKITAISERIHKVGVESYEEFKAETERKIAEAEAKLAESKKKAREELASAESQLNAARSQIARATAELEAGRRELAQNRSMTIEQFTEAEAEIAAARRQLQDAYVRIQDGEREYYAGKAKLEREKAAGRQQLDDGWAQYEQGVADLEAGRKQLNDAKGKLRQVEQGLSVLEAQRQATQRQLDAQIEQGADPEEIEATRQRLAELDAQIAELKSARTSLQNGISQGEADLANGKAQLAANKKRLEQGEAEYERKVTNGEKQLDAVYAQIQTGKAEYYSGITELNAAQTEMSNAMQSAKTELDTGQEKITQGEAELAGGKRELSAGEKKYQEAVKEAESKINDGSRRIQDAQKMISGVDAGVWYVFDRNVNPGYGGFSDDAARIDGMAAIFPVFFLLVAVLVCLTTMNRMVEEQRGQIGTLKALGYFSKNIAEKYFIYASLAAVVGSVIGMVLGTLFLPKAIVSAYSAMYDLPPLDIVVPWASAVGAFILAILCTSLVALYTCYYELKSKPAALMRPKAPKEGKRIFLERFSRFWGSLSFGHKVTARNLFRYKGRLIMTIIGIAGCTSLVIAGLGLQDSISVIVPKQFGEINRYDTIISLRGAEPSDSLKDVKADLDKTGKFDNYMLAGQTLVKVPEKAGSKEGMDVYLYVPESAKDLEDMVSFHERGSTEAQKLTDDGVIITEKVAKNNKLKKGDRIEFTVDDILYSAPVAGVTENYVYHYIYMSPKLYQKTFDKAIEYNSVVGRTDNVEPSDKHKISEALLKNDKLTSVIFTDSIIKDFKNTIKSLNIVVYIMIAAAGALAFIVLYNLTNINISERVREIATIKVLGFFHREVNMYVIRENIVMTIMGIVLGLILGTFISRFMVTTIEMDMVMFGRELFASSYIMAALLTVLFTFLVNWIMTFKMKKIDMVDSLKSVE